MLTHKTLRACVAVAGLVWAASAIGQDVTIDWYTMDCGGATFSFGGNLSLGGTIGQFDAGVLTGENLTLVGGFWAATITVPPPPPPLAGDCDRDGDVDLDDHAGFEACLAGPGGGLGDGCECFDFDDSGAVDLLDFAEFQVLFEP